MGAEKAKLRLSGPGTFEFREEIGGRRAHALVFLQVGIPCKILGNYTGEVYMVILQGPLMISTGQF